ncbi:MAG: hypothetical protein ACE5D3_00565, partial [Candidatus Binatia bacterium]
MRQGNIGIVSYGSYVPFNRLRRAAIGEALGKRAGVGERAVASYDEDSVSMAVEAMRCCLARVTEPGQVESLFLASSSPPYVEKLNSSAVHAACGLASPVRCLDVGNSARAGLSALITAARCAGDGRLSAVVMSDVCAGAPEGPAELELGDAAAAFVLGSDGVLARIAALAGRKVRPQLGGAFQSDPGLRALTGPGAQRDLRSGGRRARRAGRRDRRRPEPSSRGGGGQGGWAQIRTV